MLNFYELEYQMRRFIGYSRTEIYDMYPFERDMIMLIHNNEEKRRDKHDKDEVINDVLVGYLEQDLVHLGDEEYRCKRCGKEGIERNARATWFTPCDCVDKVKLDSEDIIKIF